MPRCLVSAGGVFWGLQMSASRPMDHGMVTGFPLGEAFFIQPLPTSVGSYRWARYNSLLWTWLFCCYALFISKSKWSGELLLVHCNEDKSSPCHSWNENQGHFTPSGSSFSSRSFPRQTPLASLVTPALRTAWTAQSAWWLVPRIAIFMYLLLSLSLWDPADSWWLHFICLRF